jgi:phosphohistidine phosphatase
VTSPPRSLRLLRHAKSSWEDPALADHDRPLAPRGTEAVVRLRRYMAGLDLGPTLVLCSSARRAVMTGEGVIPALPAGTTLQIEDGLYAASADRLLHRLQQVDDDVASVLLIGHNPGLHSLATSLIGGGDDELRAQLARKLPTGALAAFAVSGAWADLAPSAVILQAFVVPRGLQW